MSSLQRRSVFGSFRYICPVDLVYGQEIGRRTEQEIKATGAEADRGAERNPPEGWVLLVQHLNLPYDRPIAPSTPGVDKVLCGLLWEEAYDVAVDASWLTVERESSYTKAGEPARLPVRFNAAALAKPGCYQATIKGYAKDLGAGDRERLCCCVRLSSGLLQRSR